MFFRKFLLLPFLLLMLVSLMVTSVFASEIPPAALESAQQNPPPVAVKKKDFDKLLLEPVDGVSLQLYSKISYDAFYHNVPIDDEVELKKRYNITKAQYDKANDVFDDRMRDDKSYVFIDIYGAYFFTDADGQNANYAKDYVQSVLNDGPLYLAPPMTMEEYRLLMTFYGRKIAFEPDRNKREAADRVLSEKGMTFQDLQIVGAWLGRSVRLGVVPR